MTKSPIKLVAHNLSCSRQQKALFQSLHFELLPGAIARVEGANGTGKSTLLRMLSGLISLSAGEITWGGHSICQLKSEYSAAIHYVGHANGIKLGLTVSENLQLLRHLSAVPISSPVLYAQQHSTEAGLTEFLRLDSHQHTQATFLSAGQKRRLALAKLYFQPKPLWILDEPLTALDGQTQQLFLAHLHQHVDQGGMVIMSSHQPIHFQTAQIQSIRLGTC